MSSIRKKLAGKKTKLAALNRKTEDHPASLNNYPDGGFYIVEIDAIKPNPNQPRQYFNAESLAELAESIRQKGIIQPIVVRRDKDGDVFLVAGERRLRAAKHIGLEKIPTILTKGNPIEISLIENLQRENLKPIEEAEALALMVKEYDYTQEQLSNVISKGRTTITETLSLNKLPEEIKDECRRADISRRSLIEIAKQKTPEAMIALFNMVQENNLKSDQVRKISRKQSQNPRREPTKIALDKTIHLSQYLEKLDLSVIKEDVKNQFINELQNLRRIIDGLIN